MSAGMLRSVHKGVERTDIEPLENNVHYSDKKNKHLCQASEILQ